MEDYYTEFNDIDEIEKPKKNRGGLYIGSLKGATNERLLKKYNIQFVVSILSRDFEELHILDKLSIEHQSFMLRDEVKELIKDLFDSSARLIRQKLNERKNVLVHCYQGISRSATLIIAYYIKYFNMTLEGALSKIKKRREIINPNRGF